MVALGRNWTGMSRWRFGQACCIGGVPGNRTPCWSTPIIGSARHVMPEERRRACHSRHLQGTAITMEVLANIHPLDQLRDIVLRPQAAWPEAAAHPARR